jgi:rhamnosyltransferase
VKQVSVVIRTLNEARYLGELLTAISQQDCPGMSVETVIVDSGSTDGTLDVARRHGCALSHIARKDFSFGRSLNQGCAAALGDVLVIVSGHCVPTDRDWLRRLCEPVLDGRVEYSYGRQIGGPESRFSECRIFAKYFPGHSRIPQQGFFCNNANAAISRAAWQQHRFDDDLTGLEDMELAKRLCRAGGRVGYVAEACVHHYHMETWSQVGRRFEREAIALQSIMPQIHVSRRDTARYIVSSIAHDLRHAYAQRSVLRHSVEIVRYRVAQYLGSYRGNHEHRKLSRAEKERYFYPANLWNTHDEEQAQGRGAAAHESQQRTSTR